MKNIDFFYINKLTKLHNNKNIFFCKTDFLNQDFHTISQINNDVILISGNSDYAITDDIVNIAPKNIKKWYCQNAISKHSIICPIPIGMENKTDPDRPGHGIAYPERVAQKESIINALSDTKPTKFIYSNFNCFTNLKHRLPLKELSIKTDYIYWQEPNLSLEQMFNKFIDHKMVLCPAGNGIDTHRLWEVLYSNRIPITIKIGEYKIYELYNLLPIIVLDILDELLDKELIDEKYAIAKTKSKNTKLNILDSQYWIETIESIL
jgi:hypothetical protein